METVLKPSEIAMEKRREKAKKLRFRKPIVKDLNINTIQDVLYEILEACDDVRYFCCNGVDESLLNELVGDEDEAYEFRMMFSDIACDAEKMLEDLEEYRRNYENWPDAEICHFDNLMVAVDAGQTNGGLLGFDSFEQDYMGLEGSWDSKEAEKLSKERLMRLNKAQMADVFHWSVRLMLNFISIRSRYDNLKSAIDILRGENAGYLKVLSAINDAYERANLDNFCEYDVATKEFDKLVQSLPDEAWVQ